MKRLLMFFGGVVLCIRLNAQVQKMLEIPSGTTEQQIENITENNEDAETEDDAYLQLLTQFQKNPLNINTADEATLKDFKMLSAIQIQNLLSYRRSLGNLISIYELQSIPSWDVQTIQKLRPYITVSNELNLKQTLNTRLKNGETTLMVRVSQTLEKSKGFLLDSSQATNYYMGTPQKLLVRYKYVYKNLLQYGVLGEKDAGEQFFKGNQSQGFDFYSAHFFIRNSGKIKSLALGDYTVNMGQGLTQWQSLAFKKGADITNIKRQSAVLQPYNSAGEINFHRGAGITLAHKNIEATVFGSYKKTDANLLTDTLSNEDIITSLQTSGYHRTTNEVADKNAQSQAAFGGNVSFQIKKLHIGINAIQYQFKLPLQKENQPYNLFALSGKNLGNYSTDYSFTYKNIHLFGEAAAALNKKTISGYALINGLLISTSSNVDMSFLYRNISKGYQSLYTNAFTASTYPNNEKGLFSGISIKPSSFWQVDAYADLYRFPWLKYRVNSPTQAADYLIQLTYKPSKLLEIYTRFKREAKGINFNPDENVLNPVIYQPRQNWRTQISFKVSKEFTIRNRVEIIWFNKKSTAAEEGFLINTDLIFKPVLKPFSGNIRFQYFETGGYNSRFYAYENDVLYSYSIPVFYGKGFRYYINLSYDLTGKCSVWIKWAQTIYRDKILIGSGLDEIKENIKSEIKIQGIYKF